MWRRMSSKAKRYSGIHYRRLPRSDLPRWRQLASQYTFKQSIFNRISLLSRRFCRFSPKRVTLFDYPILSRNSIVFKMPISQELKVFLSYICDCFIVKEIFLFLIQKFLVLNKLQKQRSKLETWNLGNRWDRLNSVYKKLEKFFEEQSLVRTFSSTQLI